MIDIFPSFDNGLEVRVFLEISKALCKLQRNSIKNKLLYLLINFLKNHQQSVVLNDQFSVQEIHRDQCWDLYFF